ncbi:MAG TPA: bifunctional alpha,alpha-trehalose-phosphate synthase (UDP-forming)/trehalose-phosphatase [Vicinamibacterales bacterium]|nr:bifunctional alpha,alpha-trehalose-phosphate synthase (UDP-forming)/trehalose-phosphatase [Vicinamibacterales bacterium]
MSFEAPSRSARPVIAAKARLLIVSNRLPVSALVEEGRLQFVDATGGLATGLRSWHLQSHGLWIGWPGELSRVNASHREELREKLAQRGVVPVLLSSEEVERFYDGFSNRVLWPLFHYQVDRVPVESSGWDAYRQVNEKFADAVAASYEPGDAIWIHDYQLMLVPAMLRERLPDARIGFFLHIPFPSSEVFRVLPWRTQILRGLLGADLLGFHTFAYLRHFVTSLLHLEGIEAQVDRIDLDDRSVRLGVFPMGVDSASFNELAHDPVVIADAAAIREDAGGRRILLGIDRLDYTKGIPRRLRAIEQLLVREPELRDRLRYIQIAVPSRENVDSYQVFRRQVEEAVGRINGASATLRSTPIHYLHQTVSRRQLVALYCAADVMLVTPLRDGMNLVAKEFVASRADEDGVLVLSEFAGAVDELGAALVVNPYDNDAVGRAIKDALAMEPSVRRARMRNLRRRVLEHDVHRWAETFLEQLGTTEVSACAPAPVLREPSELAAMALDGRRLILLLDYDGTLVPLASAPELAVPDAQLLDLLATLAAKPETALHIVSGRSRDILDTWFGHLPLTLWAEHGSYHRAAPNGDWVSALPVPADCMRRVYPVLEQFTANTPGSLIEKKSASVAWHYRMADAEFGARQAHELRMLLGDALSNQPLEVVEGKKVIEVRLRGTGKAFVAHRVVTAVAEPSTILAVGDDRTDEEMFAALPNEAFKVAVGMRSSGADHRLADHRAVRALLAHLVEERDPRSHETF